MSPLARNTSINSSTQSSQVLPRTNKQQHLKIIENRQGPNRQGPCAHDQNWRTLGQLEASRQFRSISNLFSKRHFLTSRSPLSKRWDGNIMKYQLSMTKSKPIAKLLSQTDCFNMANGSKNVQPNIYNLEFTIRRHPRDLMQSAVKEGKLGFAY